MKFKQEPIIFECEYLPDDFILTDEQDAYLQDIYNQLTLNNQNPMPKHKLTQFRLPPVIKEMLLELSVKRNISMCKVVQELIKKEFNK